MPDPDGHVVVVDDKEDMLTAIRLLLKDRVETVRTTKNPAAIPALLEDAPCDVVLLDMNFSQDASSGREGFEWLRRLLRVDPTVVVVMITAYGNVEKAVRAMKEGATDFIVKPWENERLLKAVRAGVKLRRSRQVAARMAPRRPPAGDGAAPGFEGMVGHSPAMTRVFQTIEKVAATDASVLVLGENGTGKELVARALHRRSRRADAPFVSVDLGALAETLFESELFGYAKGAFTGAKADRAGRVEAAEGGTLFLDEIGNVPAPLQAKLLSVLEQRVVTRVGEARVRPVDIRLITATNQPLYAMMERGTFRQDLLYRINTVEVELPPLREREGDVELLAHHFLREYAAKYGQSVHRISAEALEQMRGYRWPGNVRELRHTVERAVIMTEGDALKPADLSFSSPRDRGADARMRTESLDLEELERVAVRKALSRHGGNISRAAEELGISRKALYRRIEKYGL